LLLCASMDETVGLNMEAGADSEGSEDQNKAPSQFRQYFRPVSLGVFSVAVMTAVVKFGGSSPGKPPSFEVDGVIMEASTGACSYGKMGEVPEDFGYLTGGWAPCKKDTDTDPKCAFTMAAEDDDGKFLAGVKDGDHFKMAKFNADGSKVKGSGKYFTGGTPEDAADMVKRYKTAKGTGDNYRFSKGDGFVCPQEKDAEEQKGNVFNKYTTWTSPYYLHGGVCPEGQTIILKEDCKQAGGLLGLGGEFKEITHSVGCTKGGWKGVWWNPDLKKKGVISKVSSICKKLPKDMHDFASLQADLEKMTFHCLNEATNYDGFRRCMSEVKKWNLEAAWTEADLQAQLEVVKKDEMNEADIKATAEKACWKKTDNKMGTSAWQEFSKRGMFDRKKGAPFDDPMMSKIMCVQQGKTKCTGISCYSAWNMFTEDYYDRCQLNGPNDKMEDAFDASNQKQRYKNRFATYTLC